MKPASSSRPRMRVIERPAPPASPAARTGSDSGARTRIAGALRACSVREQLVLVLLLFERLTPAEAATVLGLTARQVERAYRAALADLQRALRGRRTGRLSRAIARRSLEIAAPLRKAS